MRTLPFFRLFTLLGLMAVLWPGFYVEVEAASRSGGMVYFNRPAAFNGSFTRPDVVIDGVKVGTIGSGECHGIKLPAGRHRIVVRDQTSLLSRMGLELSAARINVWDGSHVFITVRSLQDQEAFNEPSPGYHLLASSKGRRCVR